MLFLPMVFLAFACDANGPSGPPPTFSRLSLTHRGEHLVLEAAAAAPDSTPAAIACTGPVPASGVGAVRDSVPVVHHDTARTFHSICVAEANGASTADTAGYILYGWNMKGGWGGTRVSSNEAIVIDIGDEANSSLNTALVTPLGLGDPRTWLDLSVRHIVRDSVRIVHPTSGLAIEGLLKNEYRTWEAYMGDGTGAQLTDPVTFTRR